MLHRARRCQGTKFPPEYIYEENCGTLTQNISPNLQYPTMSVGYEIDSSAHAQLGPFAAAM